MSPSYLDIRKYQHKKACAVVDKCNSVLKAIIRWCTIFLSLQPKLSLHFHCNKTFALNIMYLQYPKEDEKGNPFADGMSIN